jgi:hypothetical protein
MKTTSVPNVSAVTSENRCDRISGRDADVDEYEDTQDSSQTGGSPLRDALRVGPLLPSALTGMQDLRMAAESLMQHLLSGLRLRT